MKVELYSDIACPWCYIGKRRFERALASFAGADEVEVVLRAYQLDPRAESAGQPLLESLERKFGSRAREMTAHVGAVAHTEGLVFDWDRAIAANTFEAHRLLWFAGRERGARVQHELAERLLEAHFARGVDIGDPAQLATLARATRLDVARAASFLASDEGAAEVRAEIAEAGELGVTAVPTFVFDRKYAIAGAQPASVFLKALEDVARERAPA